MLNVIKMLSDPIADFCTRIRNAYLSKKNLVVLPYSKVKLELAKILVKEGYADNLKIKNLKFKMIEIELIYDKEGSPVLTKIERISKPGLRIYKKAKKLSKVLSGLGLSIISTPQGLMTNKEAKEKNLGGEVICQLW